MTEAKKIGVRVQENGPAAIPDELTIKHVPPLFEPTPEPKTKSRRAMDIQTLARIDAILEKMPEEEARRIIAWLWDKYIPTDPPGFPKQEAQP